MSFASRSSEFVSLKSAASVYGLSGARAVRDHILSRRDCPQVFEVEEDCLLLMRRAEVLAHADAIRSEKLAIPSVQQALAA